MKKYRAVIATILITLLIVAMTSGLFWYFDLWTLKSTLWLSMRFFSVIVVSVLACMSFIYLWRKRKPKEDKEEIRRAAYSKLHFTERFNHLWKTQARRTTSPYRTPWYFFISDQSHENQSVLLQQMGYELVDNEDDVEIQASICRFWVSETSVIVSIHLTKQASQLSFQLDQLLTLLKKKRPRQVANGIISSFSLSELVSTDDKSLFDVSKRYRTTIKYLDQSCGLSLPVYSVFSELSAVADFCEIFSTLDENLREKPFGALMAVENKSGFDKTWFANSFDEIQRNLANSITVFLKKQLNTEYRESLVAGIFQINALKTDIEQFLTQTFEEHHYDDKPIRFRGYFFVNSGAEKNQTDILTMVHSSDLGYERLKHTTASKSSLSLFGKNVLRRCIILESDLVGVNVRKETLFRVTKTLVYGGLTALFVAFVVLLKSNFDYQQMLDQQAIAKLQEYKENLQANEIIPDDLASPVFSLSELRQIHFLYQQPSPWYITDILPDSSIRDEVKGEYYAALDRVLLSLMRDYLMKDLFVYNKLDDKVKTLELLNVEQILYDPQRNNIDTLVSYYIGALKEEGNGDEQLLSRFEELAYDILTTSAVPMPADRELIGLAKSTLTSEDMSELLYQHILQNPHFARRIDFREQLGPSYQQVFKFKENFSGYLIPYLFTESGFHDLYTSTGFELASEAIKSYEGVMGRVNGEAEINKINKQLRDRFIDDYIAYWKKFSSNVEWASIETWGDSKLQISMAADNAFSPLIYFYKVIDRNTNLRFDVDSKESAGQKTEENEENNTVVNGRLESDQSDTANRVAASIASPFLSYHKLIAIDETGQTRLNMALAQLQNTLVWVNQSNEAQDRGQYFLDQLENVDASNTLMQLSNLSSRYSVSILPELLKGQARVINRLALQDIRGLINRDWQQVTQFYKAKMAGRYPIYKASNNDINLLDFKAFFGNESVFIDFSTRYEPYFSKESNELLIKGFLPRQHFSINASYRIFEQKWQKIHSTLFNNNELATQFFIRAQSMTPNLIRFSLNGESTLFRYTNGPTLWQRLEWPTPSNQDERITLELVDRDNSIYRKSVSGYWNWFRVADVMRSSRQFGTKEALLNFNYNESSVALLIKSELEYNPFSPSFFSGIALPDRL
ncbi:type VI secretion system membrane subunit TssM [Marinomonas algicola]|uniref:type VI secretion system membrane subunit TssM n=1 Tax=Marinomonas algicola TaxID=2773454 RepID=UPI00174B25E9|nr:type VI secretion system membrane subunit TssM [Marinomonas algicola]